MRTAIVLGMFLTGLATASAQGSWAVEYYAGPYRHARGARLVLHVDSEQLVLTDDRGARRSIPLEAVSEVAHERVSFQRFDHLMDYDDVEEMSFTDPRVAALAGAAVIAVAIINPLLEIPHGQRHWIHLLWAEDGQQRGLILEASKRDYREILAALQQATGLAATDVNALRNKVRGELARAARFHVAVGRDGRAGSMNLLRGPYRASFLDTSGGQGAVFWIPRDGRRLKDVVVTLAAAVPEGDTRKPAEPVEYAEDPAGPAVSTVRLGTRSYRLRPVGTCTVVYRWTEGRLVQEAWAEASGCGTAHAQLQHYTPLLAQAISSWRAKTTIDPAAREASVRAVQESLRLSRTAPTHLQ